MLIKILAETYNPYFENNLQKEIKKIAIDLERSFNDIIEEALRNLLKKYEMQPKA